MPAYSHESTRTTGALARAIARCEGAAQKRPARGSYYLAGYAVECALKACIARKTRRFDFPDKKAVIESYTHNLEKLIESAGLKPQLDATSSADNAFRLNWLLVKDWTAEDRYNLNVSSDDAKGLYGAICEKKSGMMGWIRRYW